MKKMRVLALVLVFAFAALGGAYAMWYDTLIVDETVKTGILDLQWANLHVVDPSPNYAGYDGNVYGTDQNNDGIDTMDIDNPNSVGDGFKDHKNIGSLDATIEAHTEGGGDQDKVSSADKLVLTLKNGYPGYQEYVDLDIKNVGTVPAKFAVTAAGIPSWLIVEIRTPGKDGEVLFNSQLDINELEGLQIEPGQSIPVMIVNRVRQASDGESVTPQEAEARFTLQLKAIQWNEYSAEGEYVLPDEITFPRDDVYPYHEENQIPQ